MTSLQRRTVCTLLMGIVLLMELTVLAQNPILSTGSGTSVGDIYTVSRCPWGWKWYNKSKGQIAMLKKKIYLNFTDSLLPTWN